MSDGCASQTIVEFVSREAGWRAPFAPREPDLIAAPTKQLQDPYPRIQVGVLLYFAPREPCPTDVRAKQL